MEDQILNEILKDTYTVNSFKKRFQALRLKLVGEIYVRKESKESEASTHPTQTAGLDSSDSKSKEQEWLAGFDQKLLSQLTSDQFSAMSDHIDQYLAGLNSLTIYFVFLPDHAQIKNIGEWLRKSLNNPKLIFNVKVDPGLIGGCAIVYKGVYKDYSMKAKISENKGQLIEEFRKYFKQ
jgi:hypothetical protein